MSDRIQPTGSIGPMTEPGKEDDEVLKDPAKVDYMEGRKYIQQGDYAQAAYAMHNSLKGFEEQNNAQGVANASARLGDICLATEEYARALEHYQRAFAICDEEQDIFSMVSLNRKMAGVYKNLGDLEKTLQILFDVFDHYSQLHDPQGTVDILEVIAEVYIELAQLDKAADTLRTIASIHANFKHSRLAREYQDRARELLEA